VDVAKNGCERGLPALTVSARRSAERSAKAYDFFAFWQITPDTRVRAGPRETVCERTATDLPN